MQVYLYGTIMTQGLFKYFTGAWKYIQNKNILEIAFKRQ